MQDLYEIDKAPPGEGAGGVAPCRLGRGYGGAGERCKLPHRGLGYNIYYAMHKQTDSTGKAGLCRELIILDEIYYKRY